MPLLEAPLRLALIAGRCSDGMELLEWGQHSWRLVFEAYPLPPDRRGSGGRIIGALCPAEAQCIDDVTPPGGRA